MKAKERHYIKLVEYLGNPDNDWPLRSKYAVDILGLSDTSLLYRTFTPDELSAIEKEALEVRRGKYSRLLGEADIHLFKNIRNGDTAAIKLAYQKFENLTEKTYVDIRGAVNWQMVGVKPDGGTSPKT